MLSYPRHILLLREIDQCRGHRSFASTGVMKLHLHREKLAEHILPLAELSCGDRVLASLDLRADRTGSRTRQCYEARASLDDIAPAHTRSSARFGVLALDPSAKRSDASAGHEGADIPQALRIAREESGRTPVHLQLDNNHRLRVQA